MQASDAYVAAEKTARTALANGDAETAKAALRPFAEGVRELQSQLQHGLARGDVFLFLPKQTPTKLG
jgi:hypothetical protein